MHAYFLCDGTSYLKDLELNKGLGDAGRATTNLKWRSCYHCNKQSSGIRRFKLLFSSLTSFHTFYRSHVSLFLPSPWFPKEVSFQSTSVGRQKVRSDRQRGKLRCQAVCEFVCSLHRGVTIYCKQTRDWGKAGPMFILVRNALTLKPMLDIEGKCVNKSGFQLPLVVEHYSRLVPIRTYVFKDLGL